MIDQMLIALTGVTAVFLTQSEHEERRKLACLFGIVGQPFWFYATYQAEQWGIFALCFFYTWAWAKGVHMHWLTNE